MDDSMRETMNDLQRFGLPDRDLKGVLDAVEDLNYLLNHGYGLGSLEKEIGELIAEAEKLREKGRRALASKRKSDGGYAGEGEQPERARLPLPGERLIPASGAAPKTLGDALDELAENGLADEVAAARGRMHASASAFLGKIVGK
jgi:hypothetical protein